MSNHVKTSMKVVLLLAALLCCIVTTSGFLRRGCSCIGDSSVPIATQRIWKIVVLPISGHCRRTQIIVVLRNNNRVCVNPSAPWVNNRLKDLMK